MGILKLCVTVTDKKKRVSVENWHQNEGRSKSLTFKTTSDVCLNTDPWRMIFHPCCSFTLTVVLLLSGGSSVLYQHWLIDFFLLHFNCKWKQLHSKWTQPQAMQVHGDAVLRQPVVSSVAGTETFSPASACAERTSCLNKKRSIML